MYKKNKEGIWVNNEGFSLDQNLKEDGVDLSEVHNQLLASDSFLVKTKYNTILKFERLDKMLKVTPYHLDKNTDLRFVWLENEISALSDEAEKFIDYNTGFLDLIKLQEEGYDYYLEIRDKVTVIGLLREIDTAEFKSLLDFEKDIKEIEEQVEQDPLTKPNYLTVIKTYDDISRERLKHNLKKALSYMKDLRIYYTGVNEFSIISVYNISEVITENMIVSFKTLPLHKFESSEVSEIRKQMFRELENDRNHEEENIIKGYFKALFYKTDETAEHSERLLRIVTLIGNELMLNSDEMKLLWKMAKVHDIGKLAIEGKIINKPGKLDDREFEIIKKHTILGYEMLKGMDSYDEAKLVCLQHHERWDGKGYPSNLRGDEIDPLVRIITVADCIDAMASKRVYKEAYSFDYIEEELDRCQGTQFCPTTAKAALNVFSNIVDLYK